ncbi:MAG: phosphoribosylformylglycinamidine synthase II [Candidatus Pelagibacter sp. TMED166]|nr:MAG: phosphoribosylformylglycinamidine synthase II [Candidatus Pelagibacter sp. TMED166]|tara:strand:+ start:7032 stop:9266 length:2235 start_codon:yes stop_codon:yes gene_type:complete
MKLDIKYPEITEEIIQEHGISNDEFSYIKEILGRGPNYVELGIFSVMWSEHCSYKSSIKMLKTLPRSGGKLLVDAGEENAGLVDLGNNLATAFKIESHNHPSAVEPYQGAATGVGGIMRDIFTMGARPIVSMNSLRFGELSNNRNRFLLDHVVKGIGDYSNCLGIPTLGGEVVIEESYTGNPLVNAFSLGIVDTRFTASAIAEGVGNPVFIVGAKTGRDGIHGATFASDELTEESESKKSNVQVGDPFTEKLLLEATLEMCKKEWLVGVQDMGAAGITCSSSEMSAKGECGIKVDLDKVPLRENGMNAYEILLSESQERMLVVIKKGYEQELKEIYKKWDMLCCEIGVVTDTKKFEVFRNGGLVANIPVNSLVLGGDAPQYDMPYKEPSYFVSKNKLDFSSLKMSQEYNKNLIKLLSTPNITNKSYVYNQYDSTVRTNTVQGPGQSAGIIRIKDTDVGLSVSTDCNGRYVYLNPKQGGMVAVAESARNVICSGAKPLAITNCLNFGNPKDPEIYWQFREAVLGMGDMCRALDTPVTGGNVSFYNENTDGAVYPTPVIGMVGMLENISHATNISYKKEGDFIVCLGSLNPTLGGSEYLKTIHGKIEGPLHNFDLKSELDVQNLCLTSIKDGIIKSAHDLSDGGLAVNISESILYSDKNIGAEINLSRKLRDDELLFGECQSVIIVTIDEENLYSLIEKAQELNVYTQTIGKVTNSGKLKINNLIEINKSKLNKAYFDSLEKIMKS